MTALHRLAVAFRSATCKRALTGAALALFLLGAPQENAHAFGDDPVLHRMDMELHENARLRTDAYNARRKGGEEAKKAHEALAASDERLERTRVETLAHVAGVSQAQVEQLRHDGRSWGQAAGDLGVHPGFLGVGKAPMYQSAPTKAPAKTVRAQTPAKAAKVKARRGRKPKAVRAKAGGAIHKAKIHARDKTRLTVKAKSKARIHTKDKAQSTVKAKSKARIHTNAKAGTGRGVHKHSKAKHKR